MKIVDILLENSDTPRSPRQDIESIASGEFKEFVEDFFGDDNIMVFGGGVFGMVYSTEDSVSVKKKSNFPVFINRLRKNGYLQYISAMIDYGINENPYFPKIHSVKFIKQETYDGDGNKNIDEFKYVVEMEKLPMTLHEYIRKLFDGAEEYDYYEDMVSDQNSSIHYLHNMLERIYGKPIDAIHHDFNMNLSSKTNISKYLQHIKFAFAGNISTRIKGGIVGDLSDKELSDAIMLINGVVHNNSVSVDLHASNFMIRLGKFGLQLVITDPVMD